MKKIRKSFKKVLKKFLNKIFRKEWIPTNKENTNYQENPENPEISEISEEQAVQENPENSENPENPEEAVSDLDEIETSDELEAEKDRYFRLLADYENFRRRTEKEKLAIYGDATAKCVEQLLPVVDNFERAMDVPCQDAEYHKGMEMIFGQFRGFLEKLGVTEIPALGAEFNPNIHQAIKREEASEEFPENTVCEVFQKGYMLQDRLIRPAMVAVAG
ncbi:MAG: nucleotide exchange factor GrpE [Oscillospiraceae bacterium]|nr:nucleotide exchange factor GrpE [Oscillospiraceae bacterium]MDE5884770.1 nucleotide exchange factor GrpE [Oscillospiraceae bacterium]